MSEPLHHGVVKSFNSIKGWGHIECPETFERWGKDVFLLKDQLRGSSRVSKGDRVSFRVTDKGRGPEVVDCKLENLEVGGVAVGEDDPGNDVDRDIHISKGLSQVLRHEAEKLGLSIRADGYVNVDEVLQCSRVAKLKVTVADVERVTRDSNKQRFQLLLGPDGHLLIRAVHGHSMKIVEDRELMRPLTADDADLPQDCVHGTYY